MSESDAARRYSMSFTAASLRPELARIVAETYLDCGDCGFRRIQPPGSTEYGHLAVLC